MQETVCVIAKELIFYLKYKICVILSCIYSLLNESNILKKTIALENSFLLFFCHSLNSENTVYLVTIKLCSTPFSQF